MSSIDYQTDMMLTTESRHRLSIECSVNPLPMVQSDILLACLGAIEIRRTSFFKHLDSLAPFSRSSEYKYHLYLLLFRFSLLIMDGCFVGLGEFEAGARAIEVGGLRHAVVAVDSPDEAFSC